MQEAFMGSLDGPQDSLGQLMDRRLAVTASFQYSFIKSEMKNCCSVVEVRALSFISSDMNSTQPETTFRALSHLKLTL